MLDIEQTVKGFARYHKYALGADLRTQGMEVVRLCNRAWRDRQNQLDWIEKLVWGIDELKLSLQIGSQLHAFKSFRQFEMLIRQAEEMGRQAATEAMGGGGWLKEAVQDVLAMAEHEAREEAVHAERNQRFRWIMELMGGQHIRMRAAA